MTDVAGQLDTLSERLSALHETLVRESEVLRSGNPDPLAELARHKDRLTQEVGRALADLGALLELQRPVRRQHIQTALAARPDPRLSKAWRDILAVADEAERLNRLNGRLIEEQMRRNQSALDILQSAAQRRTLYGADGHAVELFTPNRSIDEA
ncbi:MAG: flagellar protein FlgN [Thiobacillaceae bacterium]|nr:flagellar protein FlgN [Thiobacillaceae bacterium]